MVLDTYGGLAKLVHASVSLTSGVPEESLEVLLVEAILVSLVEVVVHPGGFLHGATSEGLEDDGHALSELFLGYETTSGVVAHLPGLGAGVMDDSSVAALSSSASHSEEFVHSSELGLVSMSQDSGNVVSISLDNARSEANSLGTFTPLRSRDKTTSRSITFLESPHSSAGFSAFVMSAQDRE